MKQLIKTKLFFIQALKKYIIFIFPDHGTSLLENGGDTVITNDRVGCVESLPSLSREVVKSTCRFRRVILLESVTLQYFIVTYEELPVLWNHTDPNYKNIYFISA